MPVTHPVVRCGDQSPTHAAASRSVARQRRPADAAGVDERVQDGGVPGSGWSAPCRRAGDGSVPDPAKDVAEDVRDGESMLRRTPFALENWSVR